MNYYVAPTRVLDADFDLYQLKTNDKKEPVWFAAFIVALLIMNGVDGLMTIVWVTTARAVEINPLMALLLDIHPALFMGFKCTLVSLGAILLWRHRKNTLSVLSLATACAAYFIVLTHHWKIVLALAS
jgi:hypothetical protein